MTIEQAIKQLQEAKKEGVKSIVLSWWSADIFDQLDDDAWYAATEHIEDSMDWSTTHDTMVELLNQHKTDVANDAYLDADNKDTT